MIALRLRTRPVRLLAVLGLAALSAVATVDAQPSDEVHVATDVGVERIPLAVPPLVGDPVAGELVQSVVRADLLFSGLFQALPEAGSEAYLLSGVVERTGNRHVVTASLRQGRDGVVLFARRFSGSEASLRRIAHRIADAVVEVFTGRPGAFDSRIAFVSERSGGRDVSISDYDGAQPHRVTRDGELVLSPEVSTDGRHLVFTSYVGGEPAVYLVTRETGQVARLLQRDGLNQSPALSPDGRTLAISASFEGNSEIYVTDLAGEDVRRLTHHPGIDVSPDWSPSGAEIAFQSDRSGTPQLHLMTVDGLNVERLTFEGGYNGEPAFSPDGTRLAFSSRSGGRFHVAVLDLVTREVEVLTRGDHDDESPCWSPDGEFLAFASNRTGRYDVWVMRRDGADQRSLGGRGQNRHPFWFR